MTPETAFARGAREGRSFRLTLTGGSRPAGLESGPGRRAGESQEFIEHRDYQPGDDLRHLDWSVYARSGQPAVKRFREELRPELELLIDLSGSMELPGTAKGETLRRVAALLAAAAAGDGFAIRVFGLGAELRELNRGAPENWRDWRGDEPGVAVSALQALPGRLMPGSVRILLSDLLWEHSPRLAAAQLAPGAGATAVVQLPARRDLEPEPGRFRLVDAESGEAAEWRVTPALIRQYQERYRRHLDGWARTLRGAGIGFCPLPAAECFEPAALRPLVEPRPR